MATWEEYKEKAASKGVMAKELYMVRMRPTVPLEDLGSTVPDHLAYQEKLESEGILFVAGPLGDDTGIDYSGEGLMIYRAESIEHARQIAEQDPMFIAGKKTYEIRPWLVNEGRISIDIHLSKKSSALP